MPRKPKGEMDGPIFYCARRDTSSVSVVREGRVLILEAKILVGPRGDYAVGAATLGRREAERLGKSLLAWARRKP